MPLRRNKTQTENTEQEPPKVPPLQKVKVVDKIFFVQDLAVLIKSGFSLSHALQTVAKQNTQEWFVKIIHQIAKDVEEGSTFANALRRYEKIFGGLFINMVESGEISGKLEQTLRELAVQLKKSHALFLKVRNALAYPVIILVAMLCIGTAMLVFVIPKIVDIYKDTSFELPTVTKIVIAISNFVLNNGIITLLIVVSVIGSFMLIQRQERVKLFLHTALLRIPIAGKIIQEFNIARFSRVFHSLITTDIPIIQAFQIITRTLGNRAYRTHLQHAVSELEHGVSIGEVLSTNPHLFPATVVEMINVGEKSGALDEMAKEIAEHYEEEVSSTLDGLSVLIEPVLMLIMGTGVAFIAVAVLWPIYNLVNVI